ncbi:MAG: lamin tail domain-containing protein, partial [Bacteroidota bacterium]
NYSFHADRVDHLLDSLSNNIDIPIRQHLSRWGGNYFSWRYAVDEMRDFGRLRPQYARQHLRTEFGLGREVQMRLWWPDSEGGSVHEQEYRLAHLVGGTYLTNLPLNLYARPDAGYEFVGWELQAYLSDSIAPSGNAKLYPRARLTQKLDSNRWVSPRFASLDVKVAAFQLPDSTTNLVRIGLYNPSEEAIFLNGYQLRGSSTLTIPAGTIVAAQDWHWLEINSDSNQFTLGMRHPIGFLVDTLRYDPGNWPGGSFFQLKHPQLNNAAAINWRSAQQDSLYAWEPWQGKLFINEVMADNQNGIRDEADQAEDWLEIYNPHDYTIDLGGMYLSDDPDEAAWKIPEDAPFQTTILPFGHLRFWADEDTAAGPLHLPFGLDKKGEQLYLFEKSGMLIDSLFFPAMGPDTAFGRVRDGAVSYDFMPIYSSSPAGPNTLFNQPPRFVSQGIAEASPESFYRYEILTEDPNEDQVWLEALALPQWAFFTPHNNGGGFISGNPQKSDIGIHLVVIRAWDGYTQSEVIQQYQIEVLDPAKERLRSFPIGEGIVFPNPGTGPMTYMVEYPESRRLQYRLLDVSGRVVWSKEEETEAGNWQMSIPVETLSEGMYMFQVWEGARLWELHKVVVQ